VVLSPLAPFAGLLAACRFRWASRVGADDLQGQLDALLAEAREAGSEAGAWDTSDDFLASLEPRLRRLVCPVPDACELDPALLAGQVEELTRALQRLQDDGRVHPSSGPALLVSGVAGALGVVACGMVTVVALHVWGLPIATSGLVGLAVCAGGWAVLEAIARWAQSRAHRQQTRRQRRLQKEVTALEADFRRTVRARARLDRWVADSRDLVEAEYRRYRTRAARAMVPAFVAPGPQTLSVQRADVGGVPFVASREGGCHAGH
jgi:hypothetical protein